MKRLFIGLSLCCLIAQQLHAQSMPTKNYPQGYFRNPLAVPIVLAGNFGELRPNHFHSGLDMKTQQRENLPVHAAAEGYVSRIGVSHTGFGNVLYITHPNGYTTVYAHLNRFYPALEQYVKQQQYSQESWAMSLDIPAGKFPVKKGEFVAWSGNTGGSAGPHLHFEIRDTKTEKPLNPMLFGFDIPDTRVPEMYRLAVYNADKSIYEQSPQMIALRASKVKGTYLPPTPVVKVHASKVGLAVGAIDRQSNSDNPNGIYEAILTEDGKPNIGFQLDNIGYEETRYLNAHIDYKMKKAGGAYVQLLFSLPGNMLDIYHDLAGDGYLDLSDGKPHPITVEVKDAYGNASSVALSLQYDGTQSPAPVCANRMFADSRNIFENNQVEFNLPEGELYDDICFAYQEIPSSAATNFSNIQHVHNALVPIHSNYNIRLKPNKPIPASLQSKVVMERDSYGSSTSATTYDNGWYTGTFRDFGNFKLVIDTVAPKITLLGALKQNANLSKSTKLSFSMSDGSGIQSYRAELDGKWLMFSRKSNVLTHTFDERCLPGSGNHTLKLTVTDIAGNSSTYTFNFKR
ncbi:peptidase M23-like protein [Chitinophaga skermanii]|uniref:Peptidase M23-like protein n=1 Tax=Chitinophaga skermanii TaxID=331697 RepID=A0A327R301_9BACT|nr:peptidoglycan DD-metalloendopeptidase family protein [Chitinophaga skermanii]RAJ10605.1 peptidase M23-like protein [Chitinophaga skermanii]